MTVKILFKNGVEKTYVGVIPSTFESNDLVTAFSLKVLKEKEYKCIISTNEVIVMELIYDEEEEKKDEN